MSCAALYAGRNQNITPIHTLHPNESNTDQLVIIAEIESIDASFTIPKLKAIPIPQPRSVRTLASVRNCIIISELSAPIDLRIPISRVRSETETSIIFIIPIPPTRSDIAAIPQRNNFSVSVMLVIVESISAEDETEKLALEESVILSFARKKFVMAVLVESITSALLAIITN